MGNQGNLAGVWSCVLNVTRLSTLTQLARKRKMMIVNTEFGSKKSQLGPGNLSIVSNIQTEAMCILCVHWKDAVILHNSNTDFIHLVHLTLRILFVL